MSGFWALQERECLVFKYSGGLNKGQVWYSNGQNSKIVELSIIQITMGIGDFFVWYSDDDLKNRLFLGFWASEYSDAI